jgi:hypothetical protein
MRYKLAGAVRAGKRRAKGKASRRADGDDGASFGLPTRGYRRGRGPLPAWSCPGPLPPQTNSSSATSAWWSEAGVGRT